MFSKQSASISKSLGRIFGEHNLEIIGLIGELPHMVHEILFVGCDTTYRMDVPSELCSFSRRSGASETEQWSADRHSHRGVPLNDGSDSREQ